MNVKHLDHLNMSVADLDASVAWYGKLFGFERVEGGVWKGHPWAILKSGEAMLCLYEHPERARPEDTQAHHLSHFGLRVQDRAAWVKRLEASGEPVYYGGVVEWPNSRSWYVKDPTGHEIEVVSWDDDQVRFSAA